MRADRLLALVLTLQSRGKMTAESLAEELEVSRRTILRDVEALSLAGIPIYAEGGHGGGIALDEHYRTSLTGLKETEVRSLFISADNQHLKDLGLGEAADNALLKLFASLPTKHQSAVDHFRQRILIDSVWWWQDNDTLPFWAELQQAVYEDQLIHIVYERYSGDIQERTVEPYSLVAKANNWYLIGKREGELRIYRVVRLHQVTLLDAHFQRDAEFDLTTFWSSHVKQFASNLADYAFTLRVHPSRVNFVKWLTPGRSQTLETDDQGWQVMHLQMEAIDLAKMLVFGLAGQGEVIEPRELQEAVLADARRLLEHENVPLGSSTLDPLGAV
ncbi:MAG: WYL domain-containing protein [Anaerolineae bacterium]|nr:WYL domain-containing protein [Anaerolineae bacterium]